MKLLIVASEPAELRAIAARASNVRRAAVRADWARRALLGGNELLLVANGAGRQRAAAALDAALAGFAPDALASTGLCGALVPEMQAADIVVATEVLYKDTRFPVTPVTTALQHHCGAVRTLDHIAQTAEEKRFWRSSGAAAVEMEAAAVGERSQSLGLPFYCVKAVSDLNYETLVNDLNAALRPDGHFDTIKVLGSSLRHPLARVPELLRLWRRSIRAAYILGEFFADCRF
jgi:adenosylhomocysteine nucleosidase